MATTSTPEWSAAHSGLVGDASAIAGSAQINQLLGTHAADLVFPGNRILTPTGTGGHPWAYSLANSDMDQSFTLSGTAVGRVRIPVLAVGQGADLLVSLCADSSGLPGTVITQTRIPASWITQLSAVTAPAGPDDQIPAAGLTGNLLATSTSNGLQLGTVSATAWPYPYVTSTAAPSATYYDGYMIQAGGVANGAAITNVYTIPFSAAGVLSQAIPQAAFPTTFDGSGKMCVVTDPQSGAATVVIAGGSTSYLGAVDARVYTSSLNTATGSLSAWSSQTALPAALQNQGTCAYNGYVYVIGGQAAGATLSSVYYAQVSNGQVTGWTTAAPLPSPLQLPFVIAANGFLYVVGGADASFASMTSVYYAPINSDGTLGAWLTGPSLPVAVQNPNETMFANANVINVAPPTGPIYTLAVGAGPAATWQEQNMSMGLFTGYADNGDGTVGLFGLNANSYNFATLYTTPMISVPLPASGLTSGGTYHVLMQQQGGDLSDHLHVHSDFNVFPGNPPAFSSPRGAYAWTQRTATAGVPIEVYDQSVPAMPQLPRHSWEDGGARVTTVVCASTPDHRLLGLCEATQISSAQNANQGFESGIAPWTVTGGTVAQSTVQVFEGEFAAQVTPSGTDTLVYLTSETLPCMPGQHVTVEGRMWFSAAVTAQASMSVNWFDLSGAYLSTSSNSISVPAATWTDLANTFTAPAGAYGYTINPILGGTPAATQVFYVDMARGYPATVGPQLSSVTALTYPDSWPGPTWPPLGTTVLA